MKILFAGFEGMNNTSKLVLDKLEYLNKLYLKNDKAKSCEQIIAKLQNNQYDYCIIFGQKPLIKNKVAIELEAKLNSTILKTNFDCNIIKEQLKIFNVKFYLSNNAGTSYCNNVYFKTLEYILNNNLKTKVVFIHLPFRKNFYNVDSLIKAFINL